MQREDKSGSTLKRALKGALKRALNATLEKDARER